MPRCVSVFYSSIWALWRNIRPQKTIHGVCLRDILKNIVTEDAYENSTSCNFMVQIFVYTKVHVKWGLTNMSNNHFTTKTIWTLSRCYIATSNKFFHNPNSAMHFYSNPRAKYCITTLFWKELYIHKLHLQRWELKQIIILLNINISITSSIQAKWWGRYLVFSITSCSQTTIIIDAWSHLAL